MEAKGVRLEVRSLTTVQTSRTGWRLRRPVWRRGQFRPDSYSGLRHNGERKIMHVLHFSAA